MGGGRPPGPPIAGSATDVVGLSAVIQAYNFSSVKCGRLWNLNFTFGNRAIALNADNNHVFTSKHWSFPKQKLMQSQVIHGILKASSETNKNLYSVYREILKPISKHVTHVGRIGWRLSTTNDQIANLAKL